MTLEEAHLLRAAKSCFEKFENLVPRKIFPCKKIERQIAANEGRGNLGEEGWGIWEIRAWVGGAKFGNAAAAAELGFLSDKCLMQLPALFERGKNHLIYENSPKRVSHTQLSNYECVSLKNLYKKYKTLVNFAPEVNFPAGVSLSQVHMCEKREARIR